MHAIYSELMRVLVWTYHSETDGDKYVNYCLTDGHFCWICG